MVTNANDQLTLQKKGGMTDRQQFRLFNSFLVEITGLSVLEKRNTPTKMTIGLMPDFAVLNVTVSIKGRDAQRQVLLVDNITSVICDRIVTLFEAGILVPASHLTDLDDDALLGGCSVPPMVIV